MRWIAFFLGRGVGGRGGLRFRRWAFGLRFCGLRLLGRLGRSGLSDEVSVGVLIHLPNTSTEHGYYACFNQWVPVAILDIVGRRSYPVGK